MKLFDSILDALAARIGERVQGRSVSQAYRDAGQKGRGFSVESMVAESLANLVCLNFELPVTGGNERAAFLNASAKDFVENDLKTVMSQAFLTGDCLIVPSWNGHNMVQSAVPAQNFAILGANGQELTSVAYIVDQKQIRNGSTYSLLRVVDLQPYTAEDGTRTHATRYRTFVAKDGAMSDIPLSRFPDWAAHNEEEWSVPNTPRLLVARIKCPTVDPNNPNAQKGVPLCFGASDPIREIHYLTNQMHNEFGLSEKAILADKRMFRKTPITNGEGVTTGYRLELPKGREKLFMDTQGTGEMGIKEWAPTIQLQPYLDALNYQLQRVEKCCGLSTGVVSVPESESYVNVDNVRKSTIQTQAMVSACRAAADYMLSQLIEAWDTLANYYGLTEPAPFDWAAKWSNDYINTFSDQQNAILAGQAIGATDAYDYRLFVLGETPEQAKARIEEIAAMKSGDTFGTLD